MEKFEQKNKILKIETVKSPEGSEVSFCPERGGIITSIKIKGKEILYLDEETLKNSEVNVKGGIPILFPNAGPIPDEIKFKNLKNLKQHGFARDSRFNSEKTIDGFKENLISNSNTKEVYPYDFNLSIDCHFEKDNSFSIIQTVENTGENEMPISSGFHPYFRVPTEQKNNIKFNFKGSDLIEAQFEKWANGKAVSVENPDSPLEVDIPGLGILIFNVSKEYQRIWVWSQEGKDFVCIEPIMRDKGGILLNPEVIKTKESLITTFNISLKE